MLKKKQRKIITTAMMFSFALSNVTFANEIPNNIISPKSILSSSDDGNIAENVNDNLYETRWSSKGSGQNLLFDLGETKEIGYIGMSFFKGNERSTIFSIETSLDNENFTEIYKGESSGTSNELELINFDTVEAKYINIIFYGNSSSDWNSITEVQIYAPTDSEPVLSKLNPLPVEQKQNITYTKAGLYNHDSTEHTIHTPNEVTGKIIDVTDYGVNLDDSDSNDLEAIAKAFQDAEFGDEVYFPNGTYNLKSDKSYYILLKSGVNVRGESADKTIIKAETTDGTYPDAVFKSLGQNDMQISNITITSNFEGEYYADHNKNNDEHFAPKYHIQIEDDAIYRPSYNITIDNVVFENFRTMAVRIATSHDVTVKNSLFKNATDVGGGGAGYGVSIQGEGNEKDRLGYNNDSKFNVVENCTFEGPYLRHGVLIQYFSHNNLVQNNTFDNTVLDAIDLHGEDEYLNEITGNTIKNIITGAGIGVGNSGATHDKAGEGNYIHNNVIENSREGIKVHLGTEKTIIENNTITNTTIKDARGIYLLGAPNTTVKNNTITNNTGENYKAIHLSKDIMDNETISANNSIIENNTITNNTNGIILDNGHSLLLNSNTITDNNNDFIDNRSEADLNAYASNVTELNNLLKTAKAGDTIYLKDGEWKDAHILIENNGTKDAPITIKAQTNGNVILTGSSQLKISGDYVVVDGLFFKDGYLDGKTGGVIEFRNLETGEVANYSTLKNTSISYYNNPDKEIDYKWVSLYGTHNTVENCDFRGKTHRGALLVVWRDDDSAQYHNIRYNKFSYFEDFGDNGAETIRIGTSHQSLSDSFTTVEYNVFDQCNGEIEIISNKSGSNTYRGNIFLNSAGTLTLRHGDNCIVEENFFFGSDYAGTGGIRVIGENHIVRNNYITGVTGDNGQFRSAIALTNGVPDSPLNRYYQVKNAVIENNLLIGNTKNIFIGGGVNDELSLSPENITVQNNVILSNNAPIVTYFDEPTNAVYSNNMIAGGEIGIDNSEGFNNNVPELEFSTNYGLYLPTANSDFKFDARPIQINETGPDWVTDTTFETRNLFQEDAEIEVSVPYKTNNNTILMGVNSNQIYKGNISTVTDIKYPVIKPTEINNIAYVPAKFIAEKYNYSYSHNETNRTSTLTNETNTILFTLNSNEINLNEKTITTQNTPVIKDNLFYIPVDSLSETLGLNTLYDSRGFIVISDSEEIINQFNDENLSYNIASLYRVTASGNDGNIPLNTIDGDLSTRWSSEGNSEWIMYNLFDTQTINGVEMAFHKGDERATFIEIQASIDGQNFKTVYDGQSSGETANLETFNFSPTKAKYVRIIAKGNTKSNWNSVTEVNIFDNNGNKLIEPANANIKEASSINEDNANIGIPDNAIALQPTDDAYVELGKSSENFGTSDKLRAKTNESGSIVRISYLKFNLEGANPKEAYFQLSSKLSTKNDDNTTLIFDIYGLKNNNWSENDISWDNSFNHKIDSHEITGIDETATFINTITMSGINETNTYVVDLSEYVKNIDDDYVTLMIVDSLVQDGNVDFYSKERSKEEHRPFLHIVE